MNNTNIQPSLDNKSTVEQRLQDLINKSSNNSDKIELKDNTQNIASSSNVKLEDSPNSSSDNSMNHYFTKPVEQQLTGLRNITGQDFTGESTAVVNEIDTFLNYHDSASFPKAVIGSAMYKLIRDRLQKLSDLRPNSYEHLIQDDKVNNKIERFLDLEPEFYTQPNTPQNESTNLENQNNNQNILDNQSDTYEQVAAANIESRMAWSDRATPSVHSQVSTPSVHSQVTTPSVHSQDINHPSQQNIVQPDIIEQTIKPKYTFGDMLDSIRKRRDDSHVVGSPSNKISSLVNKTDNLDDKDLMNSVKETFSEDIGLKLDTSKSADKTSPVDLPKIDVDSSNSSMEHYFPKKEVTSEEVKSTFTNLFEQIRGRRDESNVTGSPQINQLGLQSGPSRLSPLNTKPSISNLLDDTQALFEDYDDDEIIPISNIDKGKAKEVDENLLSTISNSWDKVETNIHFGDSPHNIIVDLKYDDLWTRISSYRFVMNTGQVIDYPYNFQGDVTAKSRTFDLSSKIESTNNSIVELKEIILIDLNHRGNSVWKNSKYSH
jgi:hypothetical protein